MLVYACGVCNKIPEKSRIPVSMSWVHAVIFAHWKEQKYRVSAGMFPRAALEAKITLLLLLLLLPSFTQKLLLLYFFALQLLSMLLSILRSMLQSMF